MLLVFVTSALWFLVAYASPCKDLPPKVHSRLTFDSIPKQVMSLSWHNKVLEQVAYS